MNITIITDHFPPDVNINGLLSYSTAIELDQLGHKVQIITEWQDPRHVPPLPDKIQLLQAFKTWNFIEVSRVIPLVFSFRPEIIHFFPSRHSRSGRFLGGFNLLSSLRMMLKDTSFITSVSDSKDLSSQLFASLMNSSQVVTCPSAIEEDLRKKLKRHSFRAHLETLDPSLSFLSLREAEQNQLMIRTSGHYLWAPFQLEYFAQNPEALKAFTGYLSCEGKSLLLGGNLKKLKGQKLKDLQSFLNQWPFGSRVQLIHLDHLLPQTSMISSIDAIYIDQIKKHSPIYHLYLRLAQQMNIDILDEKGLPRDDSFLTEVNSYQSQESDLSRIYNLL